MHERMIDTIVEKGSVEDMHYLKKLLANLFHNLKETNYMWYCNEELKMYHTAFGNNLLLPETKCLLAMITNKDGSVGEHWDYDGVEKVMKDYGITCNPINFYFAMNVVYAMYCNSKFDLMTYTELAKDYIRTHDLVEEFFKHKALLHTKK